MKCGLLALYNIEMWKAAGMALDRVEIVWLSDEISRLADEYWPLAIDVARKTTVSIIKRYILVWIICKNVYCYLPTFKFGRQIK